MPINIQPATNGVGGESVLLQVKVVPGARRSQIAGPLGDRLKIKVAAPPEDGRANRAVCRLLADVLGIKPSQLSVVAGQTNPEKTVRIDGISEAAVRAVLDP